MNWFFELFRDGSAGGGIAILGLSTAMGLALGSIRIRGVRLGISGVLFSALLFGQVGFRVDERVLAFLRDFGLILFAYAIGLQLGPGFASSFKAEGLRLNVLASIAVVLGAAMAFGVVKIVHMHRANASGLYSGAYTTTPGFAAGQDALRHALPNDAAHAEEVRRALDSAGLAYAVTYPFGLVGPILVIVALKWIFRVKVPEEVRALLAEEAAQRPPVAMVDFEVTQQKYAGVALSEHPLLQQGHIIFSRLLRNKALSVPTADTVVQVGDDYRAVGPRQALEELVARMGRKATVDLGGATGDVQREDMVVTRTHVLRRTLRELDLRKRNGVTIARVNRFGVDLSPGANFKLLFGDRVTVIGPEGGLKMVEAELGNSEDRLNYSQLIPIFLGIVVGVLVGSIPLRVPGLSTSMRVGLAGGPMIAAIVLSQLGNIGSVVWYMPAAANQLFRDFGLAVFLACVGLASGSHFLQKIATPHGLALVGFGAMVTVVPVFAVAVVSRIRYQMNFVTLIGWVAGAMTSSPALIFANDLTHSDAPSVAYAAVAPLAMLSPVICAQLLVLIMN